MLGPVWGRAMCSPTSKKMNLNLGMEGYYATKAREGRFFFEGAKPVLIWAALRAGLKSCPSSFFFFLKKKKKKKSNSSGAWIRENADEHDLISKRAQGRNSVPDLSLRRTTDSVPQSRWCPGSRVALARHSPFIPWCGCLRALFSASPWRCFIGPRGKIAYNMPVGGSVRLRDPEHFRAGGAQDGAAPGIEFRGSDGRAHGVLASFLLGWEMLGIFHVFPIRLR